MQHLQSMMRVAKGESQMDAIIVDRYPCLHLTAQSHDTKRLYVTLHQANYSGQ